MKKLIHQNQPEIFEKIVRDRSGRVFRVRFVVVERDGALRGRIVSCVPVVGLIEGVQTPVAFHIVKKLGEKIASPYFNKFCFLSVIKIRAPSFK